MFFNVCAKQNFSKAKIKKKFRKKLIKSFIQFVDIHMKLFVNQTKMVYAQKMLNVSIMVFTN